MTSFNPLANILTQNKFEGPNYMDWKKNLDILLTAEEYKFVLCEACPEKVCANAVLDGACERVIVGELYCDIPLGLSVIRGENVVLIGELDLEREELPPRMTLVSVEEMKKVQKAEREATDLKGTMRKRMEFLDLD